MLAELRLEPCRFVQGGAMVPAGWTPAGQVFFSKVIESEDLPAQMILKLAVERTVEDVESTGIIQDRIQLDIFRDELLYVLGKGWLIPPTLSCRASGRQEDQILEEVDPVMQALLLVRTAREVAAVQGGSVSDSVIHKARLAGANDKQIEEELGSQEVDLGTSSSQDPDDSQDRTTAIALWPYLEPVTGRCELAGLKQTARLAGITALASGNGLVEPCGLSGLLLALGEQYGSERSAAIASAVFACAAAEASAMKPGDDHLGGFAVSHLLHLKDVPAVDGYRGPFAEPNRWKSEAESSIREAEGSVGAQLTVSGHSSAVAWCGGMTAGIAPAGSVVDAVSHEPRPEAQLLYRRAVVRDEKPLLGPDRDMAVSKLLSADTGSEAKIEAAVRPFIHGPIRRTKLGGPQDAPVQDADEAAKVFTVRAGGGEAKVTASLSPEGRIERFDIFSESGSGGDAEVLRTMSFAMSASLSQGATIADLKMQVPQHSSAMWAHILRDTLEALQRLES